jgi:8-amino-3,8-dideoxy-alpha-D-manno-octulosonate transaminase
VVNPGGRGGEGRRFIGTNYRMMEIQGAIGLAQLGKLDMMLTAQRKNKARLREATAAIPGVSFRQLVDPEGDTATHFSFFLQDREHCRRVNALLKDKGCGAINFAENTWHYYPQWEHLLHGRSVAAGGWPFTGQDGRRRVVYDPAALPASAALMNRNLVYPVSIRMTEERLAAMSEALTRAASV